MMVVAVYGREQDEMKRICFCLEIEKFMERELVGMRVLVDQKCFEETRYLFFCC